MLICGAISGALIGAVGLDWFSDPAVWLTHGDRLGALVLQGKTVVGGLLGGMIGVEITKKYLRLTRSTGDDFVRPLIVGIMVGRVGCFLTGLSDNTAGNQTALPWGVNFGDGIYRHPTQIYEILFLLCLWGLIEFVNARRRFQSGDLFKIFMAGYLLFRLLVDFIKPYPGIFVGLNVIQLACLAGLLYYSSQFPRLFSNARLKETNA
jgi:phosphatidylglycerol:prolipoprotein diacylglycerol transferase